MGCPFLIGRQIKMCGAFKACLVLSVDELDSQCVGNSFHSCALYRKRIQAGTKLPLNEYGKERPLSTF